MSEINLEQTAGCSVVGKDFTKENVVKVCSAAAKYIYDNFGKEKLVIIGYDPRNKADEFSYLAQKLLLISVSKFCTATKFFQHRFLPTMQRN